MKEIPLTQGAVALVDDEDYVWLNQWKWHTDTRPCTCYASAMENGKRIRMHREILAHHGLLVPGKIVDHINRNGLDNRKVNLRAATRGQNNQNGNIRKNNTSGYIGVTYKRELAKWAAQISVDWQNVYLGVFADVKEAAHAYDAAALKYHGEFASLNFPQSAQAGGETNP